jgi:phospholipase C
MTQTLRVRGLHSEAHQFVLKPREVETVNLDRLAKNHGWYDLHVSVDRHLLYVRRFAGHVENGQPSRTGPQ